MVKKIGMILMMAIFVLSLGGCATARKQDLEMQGLRNQISALEAQIQSKDEEISGLKDALSKASEEKAGSKRTCEAKSRPTIKMIQVALKNAGFYSGVIDGKIGRQTREAIKAFQKANNLSADGKVGKNTWAILRTYLQQKIK